jgi:hypothetical protein
MRLASAILIITVGMIVVTIVMTATEMSVSETIVIKMNVTVTIAMNVTVKKGLLSDATGPALLPVVAKMIVAPGHLLGGITKIKGLQGTMTDGETMMTGEDLTLIMIVAGTIAAARKKKIGSTTGLPDTMGTAAGGVKGGCRVVVVHRPSKIKGTERATDPPDG